LACGVAGVTGDGDNALAPLGADVRGEGLKGEKRIFSDEKRDCKGGVGECRELRARDDRADGSTLEGGADEVGASEALAFDSEEKCAGSDGARVDGVAGGYAAARKREAGG